MSNMITAGSAHAYLQSYLDKSTLLYQKSMEQLSSGNKFTSVGESPISVCNAAKINVQLNAYSQTSANVSLGSDMLSMTEEFQANVIDNLERVKDLCVQAGNETYSAADKDAIILEIKSRLGYINSAADTINFNGINLLDGSNPNLQLQIGTNSSATMKVGNALIDLHTVAPDPLAVPATGGLDIDLPVGVTGSNWTNAEVGTYMDKISAAIDTITTARTQIGGYLNRLDSVSDTLTSLSNNLTEDKSIIMDADVAQVSSELVQNQIMQQISVSIMTQANQIPKMVLSLLNAS